MDIYYALAKNVVPNAEDKADRRLVPVHPIKELIQAHEEWAAYVFGVSWTRNEVKDDGVKKMYWELPESWPPKSPFDIYPKPWPFSPFTRDWIVNGIRFINHLPTLHEYIPQHLLPEKLVVHDPWKLLYAVDYEQDEDTPWEEKEDITHVYKLKPSSENMARYREDLAEAQESAEKSKAIREAFLANPHSNQEIPEGAFFLPRSPETRIVITDFEIGPCKPPIFIVYPLRPAPNPAKEAHLYLSPNETLGAGNHSFVYRAELEAPRSLIFEDDEICFTCAYDEAERIILEEDGPDGERRDPKWDELSGKYSLKETGNAPLGTVIWEQIPYKFRPVTHHNDSEAVYEGPYRVIESKVEHQTIERAPYEYCKHFSKRPGRVHPLTARTLVAAKLSIQHDTHLEREAENYQSFPKDFFEHYSGYDIVKPLLHPTPVGALVPQFFGYYVLDDDDADNGEEEDEYLSSILLIEECGQAIVPEGLLLDEQETCASLVYRLHHAGWVHNSLHGRNIVQQPGPLSIHPTSRAMNAHFGRGGFGKDWNFRMIDFGRSAHVSQISREEWEEYRDSEDSAMQAWVFGREMLD